MFSVAVFYPRDQVTMTGDAASAFRRPSASGADVTFRFCPICGTNLWWEPDRMPHWVGVAGGAFGDRDFPVPEQAVWDKDKHHWLTLPGDLPTHARNPVRHGSSE